MGEITGDARPSPPPATNECIEKDSKTQIAPVNLERENHRDTGSVGRMWETFQLCVINGR